MTAGAVAAAQIDELQAARELGPDIHARTGEIERAGQLPADLVERLNDAGLFAMTIPAELGGSERSPRQILEVIEELAYADSAVAWCSMIYLTTAMSAAQLPAARAREIYRCSDGRAPITAGATAPSGRCRPVDGGLEVSGRWAWGSGSHHADWLVGGALVEDGADVVRNADGSPRVHIVFFERDQVRLHDNWDPSGMRGTGSVDFQVDAAFVPEGRWLVQGGALEIETALYRFPFFGLFAASIAAVPLGIARRALADFAQLAGHKSAGSKSIAESSLTQMEFGQAEATIQAAQRSLFALVDEIWEPVLAGEDPDLEQRRQLRMAASQATLMAAVAVDRLYHAGGGTSLQGYCPLQRHFRDVHVATQHRMLSSGLLQLAGAMRLLPGHPGSPQL